MHGGKNVKFKQFQFLKNEAIKKLTALEQEPLRLRKRTIEECLSADAVMLAYIGDAVYSMYAVSYTHLDVYKRQIFARVDGGQNGQGN